jgi:hypothetical protein
VPALRAFARLSVVAVLLAGCTDPGRPSTAALPGPTSGIPATVPGEPPVVWVSGQLSGVTSRAVSIVEAAGTPVRLHRLARGATRFYSQTAGAWTLLESADVSLIEAGTAACIESLLDRGDYLALRVFVGAACGPRA